MSIIEQAARRLEELRRAGIETAPTPKRVPSQSAGGLTAASDRVVGRAAALHATPRQASAGRQGARTVRNSQEGIRTVELDLPAIAARGFVTPTASRSRLADEFRGAKRGLLVNVRGESASPVTRANCIMVTSSVPGEGKTFTSINLALSLARELDLSVLLVDADVIRPSVLDQLGLPSSKGLLDLLTDPALRMDDVVLRTNVDRLRLLPAGTANGNATELLASAAMTRLVEDLAIGGADQIILFDSPPLLAAPETRVLASHVGQIVVVVEAQRTPRHTVIEAMELIKDCPVVMTMLNKVRGGAGRAYGYGYGEGYGYAASHGSR